MNYHQHLFDWLSASGSCHPSPVMASYLLSPGWSLSLVSAAQAGLWLAGAGPWCPVICVQRESVRANVCPHSIISRQMTCSSLYHMSAPHTRLRAGERKESCLDLMCNSSSLHYNITDGMILSQCGKCLQPIRCREWDPATNDKSDLIAWGEPRVSPCSAAQSGYSKLMINQDLENIKNMQLSTLSVVLVVEQDKKQNTVRSAHMIRNLWQKGAEKNIQLINLFQNDSKVSISFPFQLLYFIWELFE